MFLLRLLPLRTTVSHVLQGISDLVLRHGYTCAENGGTDDEKDESAEDEASGDLADSLHGAR